MADGDYHPETVSDGNRVERELVIPGPVDEVWEIVTGDGWLADEVALELIPGGDARFASADSTRDGWVEEAHPPGKPDEAAWLVFWWGTGDEPASRVELILDPEDGGLTRLSVSETRPLEVLDLRGIPLPGSPSSSAGPSLSRGPALLAVA